MNRLNEGLLLSEEEIAGYFEYCSEGRVFLIETAKSIAKAQLAKCEPLIRADERAKTLREVGELLVKKTHWTVNHPSGTLHGSPSDTGGVIDLSVTYCEIPESLIKALKKGEMPE